MRAYLVVGAESTGTRLATRLLVAAGCQGDAGHEQPWDVTLPTDETPIVWRRSFPHGDTWPLLGELVDYLQEQDYQITVVVTLRAWWATLRSQIAREFAVNEQEGLQHVQEAYRRIFDVLSEEEISYVMLEYEDLVQRPRQAVAWLCAALGLDRPAYVPAIYDGNAKHVTRVPGGDGVRIAWHGSRLTRRVIGAYEWSTATDFVQEVADARLAADLLTTPEPFAVAEDEPLLAIRGIGAHTVGVLALGGIGSVADLAALDTEGIEALAEHTALGSNQLSKWVEAARKFEEDTA